MDPTASRREEIEEVLAGILGAEGFERPWPDDRPLTDAGLDSVGMLELVAALEERFSIRFEGEDLDARNFMTIAGLERLVARRGAR